MFRRAGRRFGVAAAVTTAVVVVLQSLIAPAAYAAPNTSCTSMTLAQVQARILSETNAARAKAGRPALKMSSAINSVAVAWSEKQAAANEMSHNPYYSKQIPNGWSAAGENVAYGYAVANVTTAWLNSSGHRANIERSTFTHIGIGVDCSSSGRPYYTQVFGGYKSDPGIPAAPYNLGTNSDVAAAKVAWNATTYSDGRALTGFTVTASPGGKTVTVSASARSTTITGLTGGVKYTFTVKALNKYGASTAVSSTAVTPIPTVAQEEGISTGESILPAVKGATPVLSGTAKVGYRLSAAPGSWTSGAALTYQWYRAGIPISGATASTYSPGASDVGKKLQVAVTGRLDGYQATRKAAASGTVAAGTLTAPTPTISGTAKAGLTLTAKTGTWTSGATIKYKWYVGGKEVSGATKPTFVPTTSHVGKVVTVRVAGAKSGYTSVSKLSAATRAVAKLSTLSTSTPKITGVRAVGSTLTAQPGTWTSGTVFSYKWYRDGVAVSGADTSTYVLTSADLGAYITVRVGGAKAGYASTSVLSARTAAIS